MAHWIRKGFGGRFAPGYSEFGGSHQMEANVSSGYGLVNPRPQLPVAGFRSSAVDEMLNAHDADETSTAQYTPAVHTLEATRGTADGQIKPKFYKQGTVFLVEGEKPKPRGDSCAVKVYTVGDKCDSDTLWTLVLAADVDATISSNKKVYMPFATRGVQTVTLPIKASDKLKAGSDVYVEWKDRRTRLTLEVSVPTDTTELENARKDAIHLGTATLPWQHGDSSVSLCLL